MFVGDMHDLLLFVAHPQRVKMKKESMMLH